jgi:hypothetical protein
MNKLLSDLEVTLGKPNQYLKGYNAKVVELLFDVNADNNEFAVDVFFTIEEGDSTSEERDENLTKHFTEFNDAYEYAQLLSLYFKGSIENRITNNVF